MRISKNTKGVDKNETEKFNIARLRRNLQDSKTFSNGHSKKIIRNSSKTMKNRFDKIPNAGFLKDSYIKQKHDFKKPGKTCYKMNCVPLEALYPQKLQCYEINCVPLKDRNYQNCSSVANARLVCTPICNFKNKNCY